MREPFDDAHRQGAQRDPTEYSEGLVDACPAALGWVAEADQEVDDEAGAAHDEHPSRMIRLAGSHVSFDDHDEACNCAGSTEEHCAAGVCG